MLTSLKVSDPQNHSSEYHTDVRARFSAFLNICNSISGPSGANGAYSDARIELFITKTCKGPQQEQLPFYYRDKHRE